MQNEVKTHGKNAALAVFEARKQDILRVYLTEDLLGVLGPMLKHCAERRLPYRVVGVDELSRVSGSQHHEGVCVVSRPRPQIALEDLREDGPILLLDGIKNPHNVGAILRSAAHFGVTGVVMGPGAPKLGGAVARTAEGGAEWVDVVYMEGPQALRASVATLRARGFSVWVAAGEAGEELHQVQLSPKTVFIMGSERDGVGAALRALADGTVRIEGTGRVESLNVAAATAVLLADYRRRLAPRSAKPKGRSGARPQGRGSARGRGRGGRRR